MRSVPSHADYRRDVLTGMLKPSRQRVYVVEAEKDDQLHYWAAATVPENATRAVRQQVGDSWDVRLTPHVLNEHYASVLDLPPGRVRRIKFLNKGRGFRV